ncbi:MAG: hypothetical protein ACJAUB_002774 [Cryomorphaceae bacterium]|jgi:hypothetical protein
MKNLTILLSLLTLSVQSQTVLKDVKIKTKNSYSISVFDDLEEGDWKWISQDAHPYGQMKVWHFYNEIEMRAEEFEVYEFILVELSPSGLDTTFVTILGSEDRTIIKDTVIELGNGPYIFGTLSSTSQLSPTSIKKDSKQAID